MELVFATNNIHKLKEVQALVASNIKLLSLEDIQCREDIPETSDTLEGNAAQKAGHVHTKYQVNCFADDTGLEIDALGGKPGVFSARYAGSSKDPVENMKKVLKELEGETNRAARFRTVICLIIHGRKHLFEGVVNGKIIDNQRGSEGFGYDPIFLPDEFTETFAEMNLDVKNKISHRGIAFQKLVTFLNNNY